MVRTLSSIDLLAFQTGDREVFRKIYKHYYRSVYAMVFFIVKNDMEANDIALETFLKLWERKGHFTTDGEINGFLLVTARNAGFDYLRAVRRKVRAHKELQYLKPVDDSWKHFGLPRKDILQEVYASALMILPRKCEQVFRLIFIEGKKTKEIAEQLNISLSTVLSHKSNALKLIRCELIRKRFLPQR